MIKVTKFPERVLAGSYSLGMNQVLAQHGYIAHEDIMTLTVKIVKKRDDTNDQAFVYTYMEPNRHILVMHLATSQLEILSTVEFEDRYEKVWDLDDPLLYQEKDHTEYYAFQLRSLSYDDLTDLMIFITPQTKKMTDRQVLDEYKTIRRAKVTGEVGIKDLVVQPSDWVLGSEGLDKYFVVSDADIWNKYLRV